MAFERDWAKVTVTALQEQTRIHGLEVEALVDVVEPVAAAIELLPSAENARRVCTVIDVGAGTTDIGLFHAVAPDTTSTVRGKLYPMGAGASVFKAGNLIDDIVLDVLLSKARRKDAMAVEEVRIRIRQVKEALFQDGFVQELGVTVQLDEIQNHPEARAMALEIRGQFAGAVERNAEAIGQMMTSYSHDVKQMEVVMAGGGAGIDFIRNAIEAPFIVCGKQLSVSILDSPAEPGVELFGAGRDRMAVALGGARPEYDALIHRRPKLTRISLGSL